MVETDFFRIGKVSSVDDNNMSARVTFPDRQNVVSYSLSIIVPFAGSSQFYYMPNVGDTVVCIFNPNNKSEGYILGTFFNSARLPAETGNVVFMQFDNGTTVKYDKNSKALSVSGKGEINIVSDNGNISIKGKSVSINNNYFGNSEISKVGDWKISAGGTISLSGDSVIIEGKNITLNAENDININYGSNFNTNKG